MLQYGCSDYINYHMQLSETINYEKYIVVSLKIVVFIKYIPRIKPQQRTGTILVESNGQVVKF